MDRTNDHSQNKIKYSIWETKTDKKHTTDIENSPEFSKKHKLKYNNKES